MSPRLRYLFTTLALLTIGLGYALVQGGPARPAPQIEKSAAAARPPAPPLPTARQILDRETDLSLRADQKDRLTALDGRWRKESAPLEAARMTAEQEFSLFMKEAQAGGKTSLQEIQRRSAEFRDLSTALREGRRRHAEAAAHILTESQQRALALRTAPHTPGGVR